MTGPTIGQARHAVSSVGRGWLAETVLEDMLIGVSEAVSNALRHGCPPVTVRIWTGPGRMIVRVHDTGPGPADPLGGLVPPPARPGPRHAGLWVIHMLGLDAALIRSGDGFTVRLAADTSPGARLARGPLFN